MPVQPRIKGLLPWLRRVITLLVLASVILAASQSVAQLGQQSLDWSQLWPPGLLLAMVFYFLAMCSGWVFWRLVLRRMDQPVGWYDSFRGFFYSQLAKYIPGKAMVVVVRSAVVSGPRVRPAIAAVSVFVETLTWLFVASALALVTTQWMSNGRAGWRLAAAILFVTTGILTCPPVFRRVVRLFFGARYREAGDAIQRGISFSTQLRGWLLMLPGWLFNAISLWFVLRALPGMNPEVQHLGVCLATVSLATVIGFVSFLPGGLGVRELVMIPILGPAFGPSQAIAAAVVMRIVGIASELMAAGLARGIEALRPAASPSFPDRRSESD